LGRIYDPNYPNVFNRLSAKDNMHNDEVILNLKTLSLDLNSTSQVDNILASLVTNQQ